MLKVLPISEEYGEVVKAAYVPLEITVAGAGRAMVGAVRRRRFEELEYYADDYYARRPSVEVETVRGQGRVFLKKIASYESLFEWPDDLLVEMCIREHRARENIDA